MLCILKALTPVTFSKKILRTPEVMDFPPCLQGVELSATFAFLAKMHYFHGDQNDI